MYHAHFGLERSLFGEGIAADAAFFRIAKHDRMIAHFKLALATPSSAIVLHGPAGVGKTTLMSTALRTISTRLALAWVGGGMATNSAELLELILVELGVSTLRTTRIERLQLWRQFQAETRATDSRLIIVVERTEDVHPDVLHALDQLTAPDPVGNPGANLVLLGHGSIHEHLAAPVLDSLRQRIRLRTELEPFTEAELQEYLRQKVAAAGGQYDRLFAAGAIAALHRYSRGVARLANTLCESALDIAAIQQQKQLTGELVAKTAVTLLGLIEPTPSAQPAAAPTVQPAAAPPRAPVPPVETQSAPRPAAEVAPIVFERRAEQRSPAPPASAVPPEPRPAPQAPAAAAIATPPPPRPAPQPPPAAAMPPAAPPPRAVQPQPAAAMPPPPRAVQPQPAAAMAPPPPRPAPAAAAIVAAPPPPPPPPDEVEFEFDGGVTDVADVGIADFPILTDALEEEPSLAAQLVAPTPPKAAAPVQKASSTPAATKSAPPPAAPAAAKPAARPAPRVETQSSPARPAARPPAAPTTTPLPHAATAKPAAKASESPRQPPARNIADATSIDHLSELDAEKLFADAELDLVQAALSASEWLDDDEPTAPSKALPRSTAAAPPTSRNAGAKPAAKPTTTQTAKPAAKPPALTEDGFDIFGLDDNAPLELIDDSTLPPASPRKNASR